MRTNATVKDVSTSMTRDKRDAPTTIHIIRAIRQPKPKPRRKRPRPSTKYGPPSIPSYKPISHYAPLNLEESITDGFDDSYSPVFQEDSKFKFKPPSFGKPQSYPSLNQLRNSQFSNNFGAYSQNYNRQAPYKPKTRNKPKKNSAEGVASVYQIPNNGQFAEPPSYDQLKLSGYLQNDNPIPTQQIPLEDNFNPNLYKNSISSYDVPLNYQLKPSSSPKNPYESPSFQNTKTKNKPDDDFEDKPNFDSIFDIAQLSGPPQKQKKHKNNDSNSFNQNSFGQNSNNPNQNSNFNGNSPNYFPPTLPNQYDQEQFNTPTKANPNHRPYFDDIANFQSFFDDVSESQNVQIKSRNNHKNSNYNYLAAFNSGNIKDSTPNRYENDFKTTTMATVATSPKRQKNRRRKRPKVASTTPHILDSDALRNAYGDNSGDFHQVALTAEDFLEYEPKRSHSYQKSIEATARTEFRQPSRPPLPSTNFVLLSSGNADKNRNAAATDAKRVNTGKNNHSPSQNKNRETFDIISIQKSKSKSYYGGTVKPQVFQTIRDSEDDEDEDEEGFSSRMDTGDIEDEEDHMKMAQSGIFLAEHGFANRFNINPLSRPRKDVETESILPKNHKNP